MNSTLSNFAYETPRIINLTILFYLLFDVSLLSKEFYENFWKIIEHTTNRFKDAFSVLRQFLATESFL